MFYADDQEPAHRYVAYSKREEEEEEKEEDFDTTMNTQMGSALPSEKLDRNNFASWEYKMHPYLVGQGYWSYIEEWSHRYMGKRVGYRHVIHKEGAMACQRRKKGFGTDSETEIRIGRPSTAGLGDYDQEGNRCNHGGAVAEGDGESENRDGEEVR